MSDIVGSKKRKRSAKAEEELEIDITQPEPLSRKDARRAKKGKTTGTSDSVPTTTEDTTDLNPDDKPSQQQPSQPTEPKRSDHGIWIGNLAFSIDKPALRTFLTSNGIPDSSITRIHMPAPSVPKGAPTPRFKAANKGFAYVDFESPENLALGLALSESLLSGRKVLIKDAKSFTGRPEKSASDGTAASASAKPPSKRVFVGNLAFDVTRETLQEHFSQAGEVEHIHLATFEDTGKCKGFAWVTFAELEAAQAAVAGFVMKPPPDAESSSDEEQEAEEEADDGGEDQDQDPAPAKTANPRSKKAKAKARKWFINRINGRSLRCEFAEDATTRYNKRYKTQKATLDGVDSEIVAAGGGDSRPENGGERIKKARVRGNADERTDQRRRKHADARSIRPGAALANAPRASGAIVAGSGTKLTFDD